MRVLVRVSVLVVLSGIRRGLVRAGWVGLLLAAAGAQALGGPAEADLDELELLGRARPDRGLAQVEALLARPGLDARQHLGLLRLMTYFHMDLEQPELARQWIARVREFEGSVALAPAEAQVMAACLEAGLAVQGHGSLRAAQLLLREWLPQMPAQMPRAQRLSCLSVAGGVAENLGQFDEALRHAQEALKLAEREGNWRAPLMLGRLAHTLQRAGQEEAGQRLLAEALARAQALDQPQVLAELQITRFVMLPESAGHEQTLDVLRQAVFQARRAGAPREEALALANLSDHHLRRQEWAQTCELLSRVRALTRELPYVLAEQTAEINCGLAQIGQRHLNEGMALIRPILAHYRRTDSLVDLSDMLHELGQTLERAGYLEPALQNYREARQLARERFQRAQQRAVIEAREAFDAERRRREKALLVAENQLRAEQLRESQLAWREWALASAVALAFLLALGLWYGRLRAQQRRLLNDQAQLRLQTEQDPLTGLSNRRHFLRTVQRGESGRDTPLSGTLYLIDLDHFKDINDRYGHAGGDAVLVEVARRLRAVLRESDLIVRWGGEEFLILVSQTSPESTDALAQRLLAALAVVPVISGTAHIGVTGSIGYASFPLPPDLPAVPWEPALELVDAAMYLAKTQGRNRACGVRRMPAPSLRDVALHTRDLETSWRDGRVVMAEFQGPSRLSEASG